MLSLDKNQLFGGNGREIHFSFKGLPSITSDPQKMEEKQKKIKDINFSRAGQQ